MMKVKCDVIKDIFGNNQTYYVIPGEGVTRIIDGEEFIPVFENPLMPRLHWVKKDSFSKVGEEVVDVRI